MANASGTKQIKVVKTTVENTEGGGEVDLENGAPVVPDEDDPLAKLDEIAGGPDARYEIRRTSPAEFAGYCCTYGRDELSLDRLQEEWGGGKFNIKVRDAKGLMRGSSSVQIAGKAKHRNDGAAPVASQAAPATDTAALLAAIQASSKGPIDMLTSLVTALITKPAPPPPPAPPPGPSILEIIGELKSILTPPKAADAGDAVKMLLQGIELGREFSGGGDDMGSIVLKSIDGLKDLAASHPVPTVQRVQRAPRPALAAPNAGTVPAREPPPPRVNPGAAPMVKLLQWLNQQVTMLVVQASKHKNPELYAELFLDNLPDFLPKEDVYQRMKAPDALENLAKLNKHVLTFRPWFEQFRTICIAMIEQDMEEETGGDDSAGEGPAILEAGPGAEIMGGGDGQ